MIQLKELAGSVRPIDYFNSRDETIPAVVLPGKTPIGLKEHFP